MTVIIGAVDSGGSVIMAADRLYTASNIKYGSAEPKMARFSFVNDREVLVGVSGSRSLRDAICWGSWMPEHLGDERSLTKVAPFLSNVAIPRLREVVKQCGQEKQVSGLVTMQGEVLLAYGGALYCIDSAYGVMRCERFATLGIGEQFASGAMEALWGIEARGVTMESRVRTAMRAAYVHCEGVGEEIDVEILEAPNE